LSTCSQTCFIRRWQVVAFLAENSGFDPAEDDRGAEVEGRGEEFTEGENEANGARVEGVRRQHGGEIDGDEVGQDDGGFKEEEEEGGNSDKGLFTPPNASISSETVKVRNSATLQGEGGSLV
jgi:hypothetical protein